MKEYEHVDQTELIRAEREIERVLERVKSEMSRNLLCF